MLGINGGEFVLLLVVALVVVGPERLPRYAEQLGIWVRTARRYAQTAKERVSEELGEDVGDVDWAALDPRRYDPRRIVREALLDDTPPATPATPATPRRTGSLRTPAARAAGAAGVGAAAASAEDGAAAPAGNGTAASGGNGTAAPAANGAAAPAANGTAAPAAHGTATTGAAAPSGEGQAMTAGVPVATPFDDEAT